MDLYIRMNLINLRHDNRLYQMLFYLVNIDEVILSIMDHMLY